MAPNISVLHIFIVILSFLSSFCFCTNVESFNVSQSLDGLSSAVATWYGQPTGSGSGGGCGFEDDVAQAPYSGKIAAGNDALYRNGKGCGACYSVQCSESDNPACSGNAVTVTITDHCPDACNNDPVHFDLSGIAFGSLAKTGQEDKLRKAGRINISYKRVPCNYPNQKIVFKVVKGSNPYYFSTAIEYENGDGDLASMEIQPSGSSSWSPMQQVFGVTYKYDVPSGAQAPYSIRLTQASKKNIVAQNVIPADWKPGTYYTSTVNF